jgi:OOP family OmpA-OmpF porin
MRHHTKLSIFTITVLAFLSTAIFSFAAEMSDGEKVIFRKTADNFIVMYDSSNSMADPYGQSDMMEIEAELQILKEKVSTLPELDWQSGIYTFTPGWSMNYFKPYLSMRTYNKTEFMSAINSLPSTPAGATQLQGGLVGLGKVLDKLSGKTVVFLFTDGQYTSQPGFPSPGTIAQDLAGKHDVCFQVISTERDKANYKAVMAIASVNECSAVVPFSQLVGHPEWLTDILFNVEKVSTKVAAKKSMKKEVMGYTMGKVLFDFDKSNIKQESTVALIKLSIFLKEHPQARTVLAGHTDNIGGEKYNIKLSQRRAESARTYLVEKMGISKDRITLSWFGKSEPVASNDSEEGRAENRRVTAIVTGM